jgi:hypothetical protein
LLAPRPTSKLEKQPLSAVCDWLLNIFVATLHTGGRSSIRNLRMHHALVTGTHSSWFLKYHTAETMKKFLDFVLQKNLVWHDEIST